MAEQPYSLANHASGQSGGVFVSAADWPRQQAEIAALFREFHAFLLAHHAFDATAILDDAASLPGAYAAPAGEMLVAIVDGTVAGCFGFRPHPSYTAGKRTAEAKRMYIREQYRGLGLGSKLVDAVMDTARARGYEEMLLDSLRTLPDAHRLYFKRGFVLIPTYNELPDSVAHHMHCML